MEVNGKHRCFNRISPPDASSQVQVEVGGSDEPTMQVVLLQYSTVPPLYWPRCACPSPIH